MTEKNSMADSETESQMKPDSVLEGITDSGKNDLYTIDNSGKSCDGTESGAMDEDSDDEMECQPRYRELAPRPLDKTNNVENNFNIKENLSISNKLPITQTYYYYDSAQGGLVKCSSCTRAYKPSTRIDTLMRHLSKKHGIFQPGKSALNSEKPFLLPNSSFPQNSILNPGATPIQIEEAAVRWILEDSLSLSALESPAFKRLINIIAPNVALPSTPRLRELFSSMLATACFEDTPIKRPKSQSHSPFPVTIAPVPVGNNSAFDPKSVSKSLSPN